MDVVNTILNPVVNTILNPLAEVLMEPVKEHFRCMVLRRKYVRDMRAKMRELNVVKVSQKAHLDHNTSQRLEVPAQVKGWLAEVEIINEKVVNFPDEVLGCCNLKSRHKLGRDAFKILEEIKSLTTQCSSIQWTDIPIPLGRIDSIMASTFMTSSDCSEFPSREQTYLKALEALGPNHGSHMVALCGMGGVGKTTLMKMLKQEVVKKQMFTDYAEVVVGEKTDLGDIQKGVAKFFGIQIDESNIPRSTEMMRQWFTRNSDGGRKKFLLILDDVWESFKLEDIGLSLLPDQCVYFKVLITSRLEDVCFQMGVEHDSVLKMSILEEAEARSLFYQIWKPSDDVDSELLLIGARIVSKCCGLPIAIRTMACTLANKGKDAWKDALSRLQNQDVEQHDLKKLADAVFETSYVNLREEDKAIFLLCGLFPEDFNIPTEDLLSYGWGLKLFNQVGTVNKARTRLNACTERLVHTNLLIASDEAGCIKMHDLVRAFVVNKSKGEHASIVSHGSNPGWSESDMDASCKRISLTCKGMSEFPSKLEFPNLSILKLMHGDDSLKFRKDFYGGMEKLHVISYDHINYPLLPPSPNQFPTNLRVLLLHGCSLAHDLSSIGNLSKLEVLSFAYSRIKSLPYTMGNLDKLRVLDLTSCDGLCIDVGVFKNLVSLEELYACRSNPYRKVIAFKGDDCKEVAERWNKLSVLEFEFLESNTQWKNLSFKNLERFKVSVECTFKGRKDIIESKHLLGNTLKLVTKKDEVLRSGINKLFEKAVVLGLSVDDINDIEDVLVKSSLHPQSSSFCNLRTLVVSECAELEYLFTPGSVKVVSNLEYLQVADCLIMKELIHTEDRGEETIPFPKLKFLSLRGLPELLGLCQNVNMITLPQLTEFYIKRIPNITSIYPDNKSATTFLLTEKVVIPKLEKLHINDMMNLKEIWPRDSRTSEEVKLREIKVESCDKLVNLFQCNPMPFLRHLEELEVHKCGSVEALFDINLDCDGEIGEEECSSSRRLRRIEVRGSGKLREVWRVKGGENNSTHPIRGFQAVERISIKDCEIFRFVFTPTTTNLDLGTLTHLDISDCWIRSRRLVESSQEQEINILPKEETSEISDGISYTMFPSCLIHSFHNLRKLNLDGYQGVEVVFEIESTPRSQGDQQRILPYLEELHIRNMEIMSHVWRCNWKEFFILQIPQSESPFNNLTTISMSECHSIKYLFSPLMAKRLSNLQKIEISSCDGVEEVVSHRDDEDTEHTTSTSTSTHTSTTLFPRLEFLTLSDLQNLKCICGGWNNEISFSSATNSKFSLADGVSRNLKKLIIKGCDLSEHTFTFSTFKTLGQLEELTIERCKAMKVIVEEEETTTELPSKAVVFDHLKLIKLINLPHLVGFFLGTNIEFHWSSLDHLTITDCPQMKTFTTGGFTAPKLKYVQTNIGKYSPPGSWFNSHMTTTSTGQHQESTNLSCPASTSEEINVWPFHNMIKIHAVGNMFVEKIIVPSSELLHLQKLEKIHLTGFDSVEEVFEALEGTNSTDSDESPAVVNLPNLREVELILLDGLRYMWKINRWTVFEFPNLTTVSIVSCDSLQHVFTTSMVRSLNQLQQLSIVCCKQMEEVIFEDTSAAVDDGKMNEIVLPRLKSLQLEELSCLIGFCFRKEDFSFPLLDSLIIGVCPSITTFTTGKSSTPNLKEIRTGFGSFYIEEDINSFINMKQEEFRRDKY